MLNFETGTILDDDEVEITDLDPQNVSTSTSLSIRLLRFVRTQPFLANRRATNTTLSLLICGFALLFLVQPDLPSGQASRTRMAAQSSSLLVESPVFIVERAPTREVTWIKISNGVELVRHAPVGIIVWQHCKMLNYRLLRKYLQQRVFICT